MKAIGYVRVSTEEQAEQGVSIEAQEAKIRSYGQMRNLDVVDVVIDAGVSAGKPLSEREGGLRVLQAVTKREVQAVVAYKLDRLFRDAGDCLNVTKEWDKTGASLHLVDMDGQAVDTNSAMGRFFLTVMAGVAEMERNLIRERTKMAMAHKKAKKQRVGSVPYGYRLAVDGVSLEEEPKEQDVIAKARRIRVKGNSLRVVAEKLAKRGVVARNGQPFAAMQIKRMLS